MQNLTWANMGALTYTLNGDGSSTFAGTVAVTGHQSASYMASITVAPGAGTNGRDLITSSFNLLNAMGMPTGRITTNRGNATIANQAAFDGTVGVTVVPEPSSLALCGLGLVGAAAYGHRIRRVANS